MYQNEQTFKTREIKTFLPPAPLAHPLYLEQLEHENFLLKQELEKTIIFSKQLEIKARDLQTLTRQFDELKDLRQKLQLQEHEMHNLKHLVAERSTIDVIQEKSVFQEKRIEELLKEIDIWKNKCNEISIAKEREVEELKVTITTNSQVNLEKNVGFLRVKYETEMEKMNLEIKRLSDLLQGKVIIIGELRTYEEQIKIIKGFLFEKDKEMKDFQAKMMPVLQRNEELEALVLRMKDFKSIKEKILEYENKIAMLALELERHRGMIAKKNKSFEELNEQYAKLEAKYTKALKEIVLKNKRIEELEGKIEKMAEDFKEIDFLKEHINKLEVEYCELEAVFHEKLREIELLREENLKYEVLLKEKSLTEALAKDYEERITLLIRELDELRGKYTILELSIYSVTEYEAKIREFEKRIAELTKEIEKILRIV